MATNVIGVVLVVLLLFAGEQYAKPHNEVTIDTSLRFLISVNDSWGDCIATVKSPQIRSNTPLNKSENIQVGNCDNGPLEFIVTKSGNDTFVHLTFHSSVIEDASPPTCTIKWNHSYLVPDRPGSMKSLLPGCYTEESREGYHMTYYWFFVYDWP